jgi:uncharacterized protein
MSSPTITPSSERIIAVDALRGFALFGILYSHMIFWYTAGPLPENVFRSYTDIASGICMGLYALLFIGKFFSFFSFLFGLSFYIQMKSLDKYKDNFAIRYGWRLLILGVIGLIHHVLWRGDILSIYVPLGFILIFGRNLSNKALLVIGLIFILNIPNKIYDAVMALMSINNSSAYEALMKAEGEAYYKVVKDGTFLELLKYNWDVLYNKFEYQVTSGRLVITFGFFLLGMYVCRMRWFERLDEMKPVIKKIWKRVSFILIGIAVVAIVVGITDFAMELKLTEKQWGLFFYGFISDAFNCVLTLFYILGLTLMMYKKDWKKILYPLAPVGKMALTSYLMQTVFGLILFYSFGFGLFTKISPAMNSLICVGIFAFQVAFSKFWLNYFVYGPLEWVWRSLTFFKLQSFIKNQNVMPVPEAVLAEK